MYLSFLVKIPFYTCRTLGSDSDQYGYVLMMSFFCEKPTSVTENFKEERLRHYPDNISFKLFYSN